MEREVKLSALSGDGKAVTRDTLRERHDYFIQGDQRGIGVESDGRDDF